MPKRKISTNVYTDLPPEVKYNPSTQEVTVAKCHPQGATIADDAMCNDNSAPLDLTYTIVMIAQLDDANTSQNFELEF